MLESKYLTQDGMEYFLKDLHKRGYRYLFYDTSVKLYIASEQEPRFANTSSVCCYGDKKSAIVSTLEVAILQELLKPYLYIAIEDHIDIVDWKSIPVDTLIKVRKADYGWVYRYFARYENGMVFAFANGATSVTASSLDAVIGYKEAKLVK
jgi:hypothetical protein